MHQPDMIKKNKEKTLKSLVKDTKIFLKNKKAKRENNVVNAKRTSQKIKNKR